MIRELELVGVIVRSVDLETIAVVINTNQRVVVIDGPVSTDQPFLVFTALEQMSKHFGAKRSAEMLSSAQKAFNAAMLPEFRAHRSFGADATRAVFDSIANNKSDPQLTYVCSMWPESMHEPQAAAARSAKL